MNVQPPVKDQLIVLPNLKRSAVETPGDRKPSLVPAGKPHPVRGHVVAVRDTQSHHHHEASQLTYVQAIGEFLGTFLFLFFAFAGAQVANEASANAGESTPSVGTLLYIALAFGFSLAVNPHQWRSLQPRCDIRPDAHRMPELHSCGGCVGRTDTRRHRERWRGVCFVSEREFRTCC